MLRNRSSKSRKIPLPRHCCVIVIILCISTLVFLFAIVSLELEHTLQKLEGLDEQDNGTTTINGTIHPTEDPGNNDRNKDVQEHTNLTKWLVIGLLLCGSICVLWVICLHKEICQNSGFCRAYCCTEIDHLNSKHKYDLEQKYGSRNFKAIEDQAKRSHCHDNVYTNQFPIAPGSGVYDNFGFVDRQKSIPESTTSDHTYQIIDDKLIESESRLDVIVAHSSPVSTERNVSKQKLERLNANKLQKNDYEYICPYSFSTRL